MRKDSVLMSTPSRLTDSSGLSTAFTHSPTRHLRPCRTQVPVKGFTFDGNVAPWGTFDDATLQALWEGYNSASPTVTDAQLSDAYLTMYYPDAP
jgi:hypothetical protein